MKPLLEAAKQVEAAARFVERAREQLNARRQGHPSEHVGS
jgi:hypothetical protein